MRPNSSGPLRVLVVDDLADAAESLALLVRIWGHTVQVARDGPTALSVAAEFLPQVSLLDIMMPGMSGGELAVRLRRLPELSGAVLVATTANSPDDPRLAAYVGLFDHFFRKPFDLVRLESLLNSCQARTDGHLAVSRFVALLGVFRDDTSARARRAAHAYRASENRIRKSLALMRQRPNRLPR